MVHNSEFQTSDGLSISYSLHESPGAAHRIALIHSLALDRSIWDRVVSAIGGAASVLTFDCRGHGKSGRRVTGPYTAGLFARDLAELMDHTGWPSAVVAGCSMGGTVAQAFGARYPDRASGLGLVDTTAYYGDDAPEKWRERAESARRNGLGSMIAFQTTRWFTDGFRAREADLIQKLTQVFLANDLDCYAASCHLLGHADLRPYLASLKMPVAVVVGEEDYATPVSAAEYLHNSIAGSTMKVLRGRHLTPVECASEVAAELLDLARRAASKQAAAGSESQERG